MNHSERIEMKVNYFIAGIVIVLGIIITSMIYNHNDNEAAFLQARWEATQLVAPREVSDWPEARPLALEGIVINDGDWAAWNHQFEQCTTKFRKDSNSNTIRSYQDCSWYSADSYWGDITVTDHERKFKILVTKWDNKFYGAWNKTQYNDNGRLHRIQGIKVEQNIVAIGYKNNGKIEPELVCFVNSADPVQECINIVLGQKQTNRWLIIVFGFVFTCLFAFIAANFSDLF